MFHECKHYDYQEMLIKSRIINCNYSGFLQTLIRSMKRNKKIDKAKQERVMAEKLQEIIK